MKIIKKSDKKIKYFKSTLLFFTCLCQSNKREKKVLARLLPTLCICFFFNKSNDLRSIKWMIFKNYLNIVNHHFQARTIKLNFEIKIFTNTHNIGSNFGFLGDFCKTWTCLIIIILFNMNTFIFSCQQINQSYGKST